MGSPRSMLPVLGLFVALAVPTAAAAPENPRVARLIADLVNKLDSDQRSVREKARRDLLKMGPGILPLLPAPAASQRAATREALRRLHRALQRNKAVASVAASHVLLDGTFSLSELVGRLSKATGNRLKLDRVSAELARRKIECNARLSFWDAVSFLAGVFDLAIDSDEAGEGLVLRPRTGAGGESTTVNRGAFRITARVRPPKPIPGDDTHLLLPVRLQIAAEPRLRPLYLVCRPANFKVTAGNGANIGPRSPEATLELPLGAGGAPLDLRLDFEYPSGTSLKQIMLSGKLAVVVAAGSERFVFARLDRSNKAGKRHGGLAVSLMHSRFKRTPNGLHDAEVGIRIAYDSGGPAFESHRTWLLHNRATFEADREPTVRYHRLGTKRLDDGTAEVVYEFKALKRPPTDWRFVYRAPTLVIETPVRVAIPLPVPAPAD